MSEADVVLRARSLKKYYQLSGGLFGQPLEGWLVGRVNLSSRSPPPAQAGGGERDEIRVHAHATSRKTAGLLTRPRRESPAKRG